MFFLNGIRLVRPIYPAPSSPLFEQLGESHCRSHTAGRRYPHHGGIAGTEWMHDCGNPKSRELVKEVYLPYGVVMIGIGMP